MKAKLTKDILIMGFVHLRKGDIIDLKFISFRGESIIFTRENSSVPYYLSEFEIIEESKHIILYRHYQEFGMIPEIHSLEAIKNNIIY